MKLPITSIQIGERQRLHLGDLDELSSMADPDVGLIQPIVVHRTLTGYELVAGRRRLAKASLLGWTEIECVEKSTLTETQKNKMEFIEDLARTDRSWQDYALSLLKVHKLIQQEKSSTGEQWTVRAMATYAKLSKTNVHYYLQVAELLKAEPLDDELWGCENINLAYKLIVTRNSKAAQKEQEFRNQRVLQQDREQGSLMLARKTDPEQGGWILAGGGEAVDMQGSPVPNQDKAPEPASNVILIHGHNIAFEDAVPDVHFTAGCSSTVLSWGLVSNTEKFLSNVWSALRDTGYAVFWGDLGVGLAFDKPLEMAHLLIWNTLQKQPSTWPFSKTYIEGLVFAKQEPSCLDPIQSVITAAKTDDTLHEAVVDHTLSAICPPGLAVLCVLNAPVVAVAQTGRIPIWFEVDQAKFNQKVAELTAYYQETVPGVEVRLRS